MDIIFDIDGTLLNIQHRVHFLHKTPPDWESFNGEMSKDSAILEMVKLLKMLIGLKENRIIFCSGRGEESRKITTEQITNLVNSEVDQLSGHEIILYLRKIGDRRNDTKVKYELYDELQSKRVVSIG